MFRLSTVSVSIVCLVLAAQSIAADAPDSHAPAAKDSLPAITTPVIRLKPPKGVSNQRPDLRSNMRIERGGTPVRVYRSDGPAFASLKQKLMALESALTVLDRYAGGYTSRLQRCMAASYTPQQQADAGCGAGNISECSYMLLVNCMGGAHAWEQSYRFYTDKKAAAGRAMQDVLNQYRAMMGEIDTALAALGPVPDTSDNPFGFGINPLPPSP
jgi:hypothetical protein